MSATNSRYNSEFVGIGEGVARRKGLAIGDNEGWDGRALEEYVDRGGGQFTDRCVSK